jgi:hypothetical protein
MEWAIPPMRRDVDMQVCDPAAEHIRVHELRSGGRFEPRANPGRRAVHARAATGAEHERLWIGLREYPGWGDVEALARHRSRPTTVVVLGRRASAAG